MGSYCPICDKNFKRDGYAKSVSHIESQAHQTALLKSRRTGKSENTQIISQSSTKPFQKNKIALFGKTQDSTNLEKRVKELEKQVEFLLTKYRIIVKKLSKNNQYVNMDKLKAKIYKIISNKRHITSDQLLENRHLNNYSFESIEEAVLELSADAIIDLGEGPSKRKFKNQYGLMVLR
ncbi:hypothetical protein DSAG12_00609 [Promethearchaeum syntrophicum]|uniref:Uncharacterized protein n=1 Tax=Promethearchaeum syntrophicum TaxID=2594042 RepID=A0A5B9D6W2_9ARCH|nr:hypothetical protein [Candidatus Prometheoarchaeum syntrophicum]QEE14792.1 hypothetical protein DSAG12_00609 [Candidatus Prometheoarchaeum syntrophicum]